MPEPASGLRRNTLINLGGSLIPVAISIVTVPLYLDLIGEARYGVLVLAWLLLGYLGVSNFGLGRACAHQIARRRSASEQDRTDVFWTAIVSAAAFGILGAVVLFALGHLLLGDVLAMPDAVRAEASGGVVWLALAVPFVSIGLVCVGTLEGVERFELVNALEVGTVVLFQLGPLLVAAAHGPSLAGLLAAAAVAPIAMGLLGIVVCFRTVAPARPRFDTTLARALLAYGGWVSVSGVISPLLTVVDRFLIGVALGARAVTLYTVPYNLVTRLVALPISLSRSLFPRFSLLPDQDSRAVAREATVALAVVMTPVVVVALVALEPFMRIWVGDSFGGSAATAGEILLVGVWINSLNFVPFVYLQARGRPDLPAKFHALELAPYLAGLWVALELGGIEGAAVAWTVRVAIDGALLFRASRRSAFRGVPRSLVLSGALVGATCVATLVLFQNTALRVGIGGSAIGLSLVFTWRAAPAALPNLWPWQRIRAQPLDDAASE